MKTSALLLIAFILIPHFVPAAGPAKPLATRPALVESEPAVKDGVSIIVCLNQPAISTNDQPQLVVRFTNTAADYINLYDVNAWCDWTIAFTRTPTDKKADQPGPWLLKMDKIPHRIPIAHKQIKPAESLEVAINLNDPPFTFHYENALPKDHPPVAPAPPAPSIRHLPPGVYQVTMTIKLEPPFGPGHHQWSGPLTTEPIELVVGPPSQDPSHPDQNAEPTPEQAVAYSAAIRQVTDKLQPGGLWLNGVSPRIDLPADARPEDVIEAAVNQTSLDSKAYRVLKVEPFTAAGLPNNAKGSAALVQVGKANKVVIFFPFEKSGWWSRFYDTEISPPLPPAARPAPAAVP